MILKNHEKTDPITQFILVMCPHKVGPNSRVSAKSCSAISFSSPTPRGRKLYTVSK